MKKEEAKKNIVKKLQARRFISRDRGFSMIEAFVAITILVTSVVGPMTIAQKSLVTANLARDQVVAFFLGQEAIEYIRYKRDGNILNLDPWLTGLSNCIGAVCQVDTIGNDIDVCSGGSGQCDNLTRHITNGFYRYNTGSSWEDTSFNREFTITQVSPNEVSVDVTVSWKLGGSTKSIKLYESLFNWQ